MSEYDKPQLLRHLVNERHVCCSLMWLAAKHHTAVCSPCPMGWGRECLRKVNFKIHVTICIETYYATIR